MSTRLWEIGEIVCDMHYGLPESSYYPKQTPLAVRSHIQIPMADSTNALKCICKGMTQGNKFAVVICQGMDGWMVAGYSYDNHTLGFFEFREKGKK